MDNAQFAASLARIVSQFHMPESEQVSYVGTLYEIFGHLPAHEWDETCKVVAGSMTSKSRKPKAGEFRAEHDKLSIARGWRRKAMGGARVCDSCGGHRFRRVYYRHEGNGRCYEAAEPCGVCNRDCQASPDCSQQAPPLTVITRQQYEASRGVTLPEITVSEDHSDLMAFAQKSTPASARTILEKVDAGALNLPKDVMDVVLVRAGGAA